MRSRSNAFLLGALALSAAGYAQVAQDPMEEHVTQGALRVKTEGGIVECPLKHTDVKARVSGFIARVKVTQTFHNPLDEKIEAVYVFPLPHKAAVDEMTMVIGERRIVGVIKRRAEARRIYEEALRRGLTASLLEQERPNIFTQSVGNIEPGQEILIEISYVDVLRYDMGTYEFHFPMVVGPRYIPGKPTSTIPPLPPELKGKVGELDRGKIVEGTDKPKGTGWAPDTGRVPDASRITPPVLKPGLRNGHDISLSVALDAGVPVQGLTCTNHEADVKRLGRSKAMVTLSPADSIPNKDFVLKYNVVGEKPEMAVLCHTDESGAGYFLLMVQPKEDERLKRTPPREICFLIDVSGSMSGAPTAKVRDAMQRFLRLCKDEDTIQVITFAGRARKLFEGAVPVTDANIERAVNFTRGIRGGGGTRMLQGVKMAINDPLDAKRVRIVVMLTDGYIGNEAEIISEVGRRCGDRIRFWCIGMGSSVNRFLVDGVARQGGGMSKVLGLNDDTEPLVQEVMFRIHRAQLANVNIEWGDLIVRETYPVTIPELWAGRPIVVYGCYEAGGREATVNVTGEVEGEPANWPLTVHFPEIEPRNDVLAKVWARQKIEELMHQTYYAGSPEVEEEVTEIALHYGLMSQYTSFVAVDEAEAVAGQIGEPARPPRRMLVPVPIPEGTRFGGFFGDEVGADINGAAELFGRMEKSMARRIRPTSPAIRVPRARNSLMRGHGLGGSRKKLEAAKMLRRAAPRARAMVRGSTGRAAIVAEAGLAYNSFRALDAADAPGFMRGAFYAKLGDLKKRTPSVLKKAGELGKKGNLVAARAKYTLAYLLDTACVNVGRSNGQHASAALAAINEIEKELLDSRTKAVPALENGLYLTIRDQSIAGALDRVAKAAGFTARLIPGSVEDACALMKRKSLRVSYLALNRATVARALDWILRPVRMTWWVEGGGVVAATSRRGPGESAWVYDVSSVAFPTADELKKIKNYRERTKAAQESADEFLNAVQKALSLEDDAIAWFAPGELLLFGDAGTHAAAAELFAELADPRAELARPLAGLHAKTALRAGERKEAQEKALAGREKALVLESLNTFGWRLLAAAAAGKLDLEALTELEMAWKRPELPELAKDARALFLLRSLWAITESSRALPKEAELAGLAASVRDRSRRSAEKALTTLEKSPRDRAACLGALYAALALGDDEEFRTRAGTLLAKNQAYGALAAALLAPAGEIDSEALVKLVSKGARGEDMVVLTALACRRAGGAGGAAWKAFRREARAILGRQPLRGGVVVLVNRLGRARLVLARGPEE